MSSGFFLLFGKHFALRRSSGGMVAARILLPGLTTAARNAPGFPLAAVHRRGMSADLYLPGVPLAQSLHSGFRFHDISAPGIASAQAIPRGWPAADIVSTGFPAAQSFRPGWAELEPGLQGLTSVQTFHSGFPAAYAAITHGANSRGITVMADATNFDVVFREDGTATVVARLAARSGAGSATGAVTGQNGEGNWVKQVDLTSIAYATFDESNNNAAVEGGSGTVSISGAVLDSPVTGESALWTRDNIGYNFLHDLPPACFPIGGHVYRVEYKITHTGGAVGWGVLRGRAEEVLTS